MKYFHNRQSLDLNNAYPLKMNLHKIDIAITNMELKKNKSFLPWGFGTESLCMPCIVWCLIADGLWMLTIMATKISTRMKNLMKEKENQSFKGKTGHGCTRMMIDHRLTDRRWMEDTWGFKCISTQMDQHSGENHRKRSTLVSVLLASYLKWLDTLWWFITKTVLYFHCNFCFFILFLTWFINSVL